MTIRQEIREQLVKGYWQLAQKEKAEKESGEAMDSIARAYWQGYTEALDYALVLLSSEVRV